LAETGISDRVRILIADQIESVVQLEILLLLRDGAEREFAAREVADVLRIGPTWAEPHLVGLCARGMLVCTNEAEKRYRYQPNSAELAAAIDELAQSYAERRVSVTALIFSRPPSPLRDFSDAFRLRKERPNG